MTITQDLRTRRKHRGKTPWQLVQTIGRLEREADAATCQLVAMATEIDALKAERNQLAARLDEETLAHSATVDDLKLERDELRDQLAALRVKFGPQLAAEANAAAVTVPPMVRDTSDPADQATQPIPVLTLQQAHGIGPVTVPGRHR